MVAAVETGERSLKTVETEEDGGSGGGRSKGVHFDFFFLQNVLRVFCTDSAKLGDFREKAVKLF